MPVGRPEKLKGKVREALLVETTIVQLGVGIATPEEIDALNILHATMLAMRRAVDVAGLSRDCSR